MRWNWSPNVHRQIFGQKRQDSAGDQEVTDRDYVDFIRQFSRAELVALIAAIAPAVSFNQTNFQTNTRVLPWGLADIARVSLASGSERNRLTPTVEDLDHCLLRHNSLGHPGLKEQEPGAAANTFLQLAFSQFPFQRNLGPLTGRSIALFTQTAAADPSQVEVLRGDWQTELLGCTLAEYIGVTQLIMAAVKPNNGRFDPAWIERDDLKDLTDIFDPAITRHVLSRHLVAPADSFPQRDRETPNVRRRFTFNPLMNTPVVSGLAPDLLIPIPDYVLWKPTPYGLYYTGVQKWGDAFARDLGRLFEAYVGRQLHLLSGVDIYPEITYRQGKEWKKSVDWIVVFPDLVLLVEAKAARSKEVLRTGDAGAATALQQAFNKGNTQLGVTFDLINARTAGFEHIPVDRPIVGIVVTIEDFHVANSALHLPMYSGSTKLPTLAVSIEELEGIVGLGPAAAAFVRENTSTAPGEFANLGMALSAHDIPDNPILRAGLDATPIQLVKDDATKDDE